MNKLYRNIFLAFYIKMTTMWCEFYPAENESLPWYGEAEWVVTRQGMGKDVPCELLLGTNTIKVRH